MEIRQGKNALCLMGPWRLSHLSEIAKELQTLVVEHGSIFILDGRDLTELDTSAALLVHRFLTAAEVDVTRLTLVNFSNKHRHILQLINEHLEVPSHTPHPPSQGLVSLMGRGCIDCYAKVKAIVAFIGQVGSVLTEIVRVPARLRIKELFVQLEAVCLHAIPIVCLVTLLVGVVIAYLFSLQLEKYGANIFVVDSVGLAICRELSPIIVAIIIAGRSGAAFTAQIGTMKVTEEIDALTTLGLSPLQVVVIPRLLALVLALPFLVFVGDLMGLLGGMLVAQLRLGITYATFLERLQSVLPLSALIVGLIKAPVFALFIAVIGCRMGLSVKREASSVGRNTTSTVVQSIVSVILLDAAFAVLFVELGI
jgi:phospholipid/cholesterol/gamma-HCH transport system permease protein